MIDEMWRRFLQSCIMFKLPGENRQDFVCGGLLSAPQTPQGSQKIQANLRLETEAVYKSTSFM